MPFPVMGGKHGIVLTCFNYITPSHHGVSVLSWSNFGWFGLCLWLSRVIRGLWMANCVFWHGHGSRNSWETLWSFKVAMKHVIYIYKYINIYIYICIYICMLSSEISVWKTHETYRHPQTRDSTGGYAGFPKGGFTHRNGMDRAVRLSFMN